MTGYNLPPGCRESDLPGNSAQDMRAERFAEEFELTLDAAVAAADHVLGELILAQASDLEAAYIQSREAACGDTRSRDP